MTEAVSVAVAPDFHLPDAPFGRVLIADSAGWRPLCDNERSAIVPQRVALDPPNLNRQLLLFALPVHLRSAFWGMMEQGHADGDFDAFASEVAQFLDFKQLPPPKGAVFELVLNGPGGMVEPRGLWAVINLGDDPVVMSLPRLRVCLRAGEGGRLPEEILAEVVPPESNAPDVLLLVRRPA
jgi:hypothetical protein